MDINKRMELKGRAVQPTDKTPLHKNTCDDVTAKMEVFTAVLKLLHVDGYHHYRHFEGS